MGQKQARQISLACFLVLADTLKQSKVISTVLKLIEDRFGRLFPKKGLSVV